MWKKNFGIKTWKKGGGWGLLLLLSLFGALLPSGWASAVRLTQVSPSPSSVSLASGSGNFDVNFSPSTSLPAFGGNIGLELLISAPKTLSIGCPEVRSSYFAREDCTIVPSLHDNASGDELFVDYDIFIYGYWGYDISVESLLLRFPYVNHGSLHAQASIGQLFLSTQIRGTDWQLQQISAKIDSLSPVSSSDIQQQTTDINSQIDSSAQSVIDNENTNRQNDENALNSGISSTQSTLGQQTTLISDASSNILSGLLGMFDTFTGWLTPNAAAGCAFDIPFLGTTGHIDLCDTNIIPPSLLEVVRNVSYAAALFFIFMFFRNSWDDIIGWLDMFGTPVPNMRSKWE